MHPSTATYQSGLRVYKIVLLGEGGVGKSAVTMQFVSHCFLDYHDPTIEDAYQRQTVIDGEAGMIDILDTAGQQEFTAMHEQYMRSGEGFIIVYSITDRHTFREAAQYKAQVDRVRRTENVPLVLVGNKTDLEGKRQVTTEEGQSLAKQFDCHFFETSAALRQNIEDVFHTLIREIRKKERVELKGQRKKNRKWKNLGKSGSIFGTCFRKREENSI